MPNQDEEGLPDREREGVPDEDPEGAPAVRDRAAEDEPPNQDEVRLTVPATPEYLRLARVTATGLASRLGFTYDEVEDLRLAIDELCFALIGTKGKVGRVSLRYALVAGALEVEGSGEFEGDHPEPALSSLSKQILKALVDDYGVAVDARGRPVFRLRKVRHEST